MQPRFRWFNISPFDHASVVKLAASLQKKVYHQNASTGFNLEIIRKDRIAGTFTHKREFVEEVRDPFGNLVKVRRIAFDQCNFLVGVNSPNIRLQNFARLGKRLTETIADALDYTISITPIEIDPLRWAQCITDKNTSVSLSALRSFPFEVSSGIAGSIRLTGSGDIAKELERLLGSRKVRASNIFCTIKKGALEWKVEFRSTGAAVVHKGDYDRIIGPIGDALTCATI
ncbi:hypothetical protein [Prosthecobacter sp.]|uniref:hypothetical protein n=1 Tax=Prosthecobacter sp. TaxID=1965333 RepID=UPI003783D377